MREGRTYRINLVTVGHGCVQVALYASGDFGGSAAESLSCDDHTVFAAPATGRYTLHVRAPRASRVQLPYRLRVGPAERDDSAPGVVLADDRRVAGELAGDELDALDLYRFTLARRSDLRVRLRTTQDFDLRLLSEGGRRLGCSCGSTGKQGAHPPPGARALLHRRAGARRRRTEVRAVAPRPHHHAREDARRRRPQRHGGARRDRGALAARHARGVGPREHAAGALRPARRLAVPLALPAARERHRGHGGVPAAVRGSLARDGRLRGHAGEQPEQRRAWPASECSSRSRARSRARRAARAG